MGFKGPSHQHKMLVNESSKDNKGTLSAQTGVIQELLKPIVRDLPLTAHIQYGPKQLSLSHEKEHFEHFDIYNIRN